jgi:hypothetical protein
VLYGTSPPPLAEEPTKEEGVLLGYSVELTGEDLAIQRLEPGDVVPLTLFWRARQPVQQDAKVFVHLLDSGGQLVAQHDGEPVSGLRPTSTWKPGELIVDRHGVLLPDDLPPGEYQLVVGLYDPVTGNRLLVTAGTSAPPGNSWPVGTVQVR